MIKERKKATKFLGNKTIAMKQTIASVLDNFYLSYADKVGSYSYNQEKLYEKWVTNKDRAKITKLFNEELSSVYRNWSYLVVVIFDDGDELSYVFESGVMEDFNTTWTNNFISARTTALLEEFLEEEPKSYFWVVSPSTTTDWNSTAENLLQYYLREGTMGEENKHLGKFGIIDKLSDFSTREIELY